MFEVNVKNMKKGREEGDQLGFGVLMGQFGLDCSLDLEV